MSPFIFVFNIKSVGGNIMIRVVVFSQLLINPTKIPTNLIAIFASKNTGVYQVIRTAVYCLIV